MTESPAPFTSPVHPFFATLQQLAAVAAPYFQRLAEIQAQANAVLRSQLDSPEVRRAIAGVNQLFSQIDRAKLFALVERYREYKQYLDEPKSIRVAKPRRCAPVPVHRPAGFLARAAPDDNDPADE
jgi:hypothetical protein